MQQRRRHALSILLLLLLPACSPAGGLLPAPALPATPSPTHTQPAGFLNTPVFGPLVGPLIQALNTPTATQTPTVTPTATNTPTLTPTATRTPLPTFTPTPSRTPTPTRTGRPTLTPTPTETPAPQRLARLFPVNDRDGVRIDWSYARITDLTRDKNGKILRLDAFLSFQLVDRAIHRATVQVLGKDLTVYYLNTQRDFDGKTRPVQLILGGEWGKDVPIQAISSPGSFFVEAQVFPPGKPFDAFNIHGQANKNYLDSKEPYQGGIPIAEFEKTLAGLPDELIVLADHIVLVPYTLFEDVEYFLANTPYLAARYAPLVSLDPLGKVTGPSPAAQDLANYLLHTAPLGEGAVSFSSNTLILLTGK